MPTIMTSDPALHIRTDGDDRRPALLLLNPLGTTLEVWDPMVEELQARNFLIRFDQRGHGRSAGGVEPYEISDLGDDALRVLDALEIDRANVFGASLGALVALWLAAEHPNRVRRLVLASTGTQLGPDRWWHHIIDTVEKHGLESIADHLEAVYFSDACRSSAPDVCSAAREMLLATPPDVYLAGSRAHLRADMRATASKVRASTLIVFGENDPFLVRFPALDLLGAIDGAEAVQVGGAAHRAILEQPALIASVVDDFLSDPDGR